MKRKSLLVAGLVVGSLFLLGVSPALQELIDRVAAIEGQLAAEPRAPRVFDANGTDLGRLLSGVTTEVEVYNDAVAAVFRVSTSGAVARQGTVRFEEPDCEGRAFTSHNDGRDIGRLAVIGPEFGPNRFFVGIPEIATNVPILSHQQGDPGMPCMNVDQSEGQVHVLREVTAAELGFIFPVSPPLFFGPPQDYAAWTQPLTPTSTARTSGSANSFRPSPRTSNESLSKRATARM